MKNVLSTIPRSKFRDWPTCERTLRHCDGETIWPWSESEWYWLVNMTHLPKEAGIGSLCYMVFDGQIRGYMDVVDIDRSENYRDKHDIGKARNTHCFVLANWHPVPGLPDMNGFQGWRYTELRP